MKYFVADPTADRGIRQLAEDKVTLRDDGALAYRHPLTGSAVIVESENWSTDWDRTVIPAYNCLNEEIARAQAQVNSLTEARRGLIDASPNLQRLTRQMKLF